MNADSTKVLVADDDPVSRRLLQIALTNAGYRVVVAADGEEAIRVIHDDSGWPRIAILDWMMPGLDGVEVCRAIRRLPQEPYVYVILLTIKGQQEEIVEGLEAGANDYVTKPFDLQELQARVRAGKRILELQDQLALACEHLRFQTTHDFLTGCLSRSAIRETLQKELSREARRGTGVAVIMVDLDHFKVTNDTYGHDAGDVVLQETVRRMQSSVRSYDSIGRYGGEEFLVVAPGCNMKQAGELAERLRANVSAEPIRVASNMIPTRISLGIAVRTGQAQDCDQLLREADESLYAAKKAGRDRVAQFTG